MKSRVVLLLAFFLPISALFSQIRTDRAVVFYQMGLLEPAQFQFKKAIESRQGDLAKNYYYLGRIAMIKQMPDSARYYIETGLSQSPDDPFLLIGEGELQLASNPEKARQLFEKALAKDSKEDAAHVELARIYLFHKMPEYRKLLEEIKEDHSKMALLYVVEGDALMAEQKYGEALSAYEQAIYFDPQCEEAYLKYARGYQSMSPQLALEMLDKLLGVRNDCEIAYRERADIYFGMGNFREAVGNYEKYMNSGIVTTPQDKGRYATLLFYNKDYDKTRSFISEGLKKDPDNLVMSRLLMYLNASGSVDDQQIALADQFMKKYSEDKYIPLDYVYFGNMMKGGKHYQEAVEAFRKAMRLDPEKTELYREIAEAYEANNQYGEAMEAYNDLIGKSKDIKASDFLAYGRTCYFAADAVKNTPDSIQGKTYLTRADSLFNIVIQKVPENVLGYFWRARALSLIDAETTQGLAKPYYEKVIAILEPEKKDTKKLIESYNYLGYYYYVAKQMPESLSYWNKTLALDPANEVAKKAIEGIGREMK